MLRLINNRFFTLIEAILLAAFAVITLVLPEVFTMLFGIALSIYTLVFVFTKVLRYRGMVQMIALIEFFVMVSMIVFVFAKDSLNIEIDIINIAIGLAMWIRATTEIMHSFFGQGQGKESERHFNGWKVFAYILLLTLGTFIATSSAVNDKFLRYLVVGIAVASAIIMCVLTYTNFVDYRATHPKAVKEKVNKTVSQKQLEDTSKEESTVEGVVEIDNKEPEKKKIPPKKEKLQLTAAKEKKEEIIIEGKADVEAEEK